MSFQSSLPSKEGKSLTQNSFNRLSLLDDTTTTSSSMEEIRFTRPLLNPNVEGILKGELVEVLESSREKLLTAEQQRILARQDILIRQREREFHDAMEAQKVAEFREMKRAEEEKMIRIQEEKNAIILERVKQRDEKRRKAREERKAKEAMNSYLLSQQTNNAQRGWYNDDGDVGEGSPGRQPLYTTGTADANWAGQEQNRRRSTDRRQSQRQSYPPPPGRRSQGQSSPYREQVKPMTELPGEYEDGVWSDAEDYGYSKEFPYPKKQPVINEDQEVRTASSLEKDKNLLQSPAFPVDNPYKDVEHLLVDDPGSSSDQSSGSERNAKSPIPTGRLEGLEKGIHYIDKAAANLQALLGHITDYDEYSSRTPVNTAVKGKRGGGGRKGKGIYYALERDIEELNAGESQYDLSLNDVGTEVKAVTRPEDVNPNMVDKSTQVRARDILLAYKALLQSMSRQHLDDQLARKQREELDAEAAIQEYIFRLERKESLRRDAMTLTRPLGYRELELNRVDKLAGVYDVETQVNERMMDTEYAAKKGLELADNDILWPSIGTFDIEFAVKRIQDYITQCWKLDPKWMFDIKVVQSISDDFRRRVVFEVKFSVPTQHHPVPPATASVFFIMELSHYAPKEDIVKVHYVIEGNRFLHAPGVLPFQDRWLWSVVTDKNRILRSIDF